MADSSHPAPRIFVSHSHKDNDFGFKLVQDLRRVLGDETAVWFDARGGLYGGDAWWDKIKEELKARSVFIVILSPDAITSSWVKDEVRIAWKQKNSLLGKQIIPILYRPCEVPDDLDTLQVISCLSPDEYEAAFKQLLEALGLFRDVDRSSPTDRLEPPHAAFIRQLVPQIEVAFSKKDWSDVIRKVDFLIKRAPGNVSSSIYRMQGLALLERGETERAQEALEAALALVSDQEQRLILLNDYTSFLISQGRRAEALRYINEALSLAPNDPMWLKTQRQAITQLRQNKESVATSEPTQFPNPKDKNIPPSVDNFRQVTQSEPFPPKAPALVPPQPGSSSFSQHISNPTPKSPAVPFSAPTSNRTSARLADHPAPSSPLRWASNRLKSLSSIAVPLFTVQRHTQKSGQNRNHLFYPSLGLLLLLLIALAAGGGYYYLKATTNINVPQKLHDAQATIIKAKGEVTVNPAVSLHDLATAQSTLRTLLTGSLTNDQRSTVLHLLQIDVPQAVQTAINNYNTKAAITSLPCSGMAAPTPLNVGTTGTQVRTITLVPGKNGQALLYAIGLDSKVYQVVNNSLIHVPALLNTRVLDIASYGQQLLLLTAQPASGTPTSYSLALLASDQSKVEATTTIGRFLGNDGQLPRLIAASPPDIYVVIGADSTQTMTTILDYASNNKLHQPLGSPPTTRTITVSNPIMSLAAFPMHQLFLLLADGTVQSLQFAGGAHATASVLLQQAVAQPLLVSAKAFTWTMTVPMVPTGGMTSLSVPGATLSHTLAVALVKTVPHLYILDANLHRLLDLTVADTSAVAVSSSTTTTGSVTPTAAPVTLRLERQYASPTLFAQAKSMAVDPQGTQVNVVAQTSSNASSILSLISFNASSQNACT